MPTPPSTPPQLGRDGYTRAKAEVLSALSGRVLEIGAGRGANFGDLRPGVTWVGLEPDRRRRDALARNARSHGHHAEPLAGRAERIPLPDNSVDAVFCTITLCSVSDQAATLAEVARVLVPGGLLAYAEHVAAPSGSWKHGLQRAVAPVSRVVDHGCDPARDTEAALRTCTLQQVRHARFDLPTGVGITLPYVVGIARAEG